MNPTTILTAALLTMHNATPAANLYTPMQQHMPAMQTDKLTNPTVHAAIQALATGNTHDWFARFTDDAALYDDGNKMNFREFFTKALGHERFTSIDNVTNNGLHVYGHFHSDQWGDFKTYFKFYINTEGRIYRLDIGQASY